MHLPPGVSGVARHPAVDQTLSLALALLPDTEHVAFIGGTTDLDRAYEVSARPDITRVTGHLDQIDLTGLSLTEMGERLAGLPPHTIVFGISLFRDGTGRSIRGTDAMRLLSQWSDSPIFTTHAQMVGLGPVGGWVTDYQEVGRAVGHQLSEVLKAPPGTPLPARQRGARPAGSGRPRAGPLAHSRKPPSALHGGGSFGRCRCGGATSGPFSECLRRCCSSPDSSPFLLLERRRRQVAEAEARASQERIAHINRVGTVAELSGSFAHELSGPLGAIANNARAARRFLLQEAPDLKEVRASLQDIEGSAERASQVLARLRAVLRKEEFQASPVDVRGIVTDAVKLVSSEAARRKTRLDMVLAPGLPRVQGDAVLLLQVLLNLLLNALDAVSPSSRCGTGR